MADPTHEIVELLREDTRYKFAAYAFVFEALSYAHTVLGMGEPTATAEDESPATSKSKKREKTDEEAAAERHLTGQQLCEAIRRYALEQYGYMAKCVLNSWGLQKTGDFGDIVFNLIRIGHMRKTDTDRREDFDDVFDFESALEQGFKITPPSE
jgi:uncharacterized repeat protein (TIGR04138 family)